MDFSGNDDHRILGDAIDALMRDFPDDYWMEKDRAHDFPWEFYNAFAAAGYLGLVVPEDYGGAGLGLAEGAQVLSRVAGSGGALSAATAVHVSLFGMTPVIKFGAEEMKRKYLPPLVAGDLHVCFGVTEPDAGTDTTSIKTSAVRDGDHYVINGRKVWTSKAEQSQKCLLLTRTTPLDQCRKKTDGMTLFLADIQNPAVTIRPIPKMGREAVGSCEVFYDGLRVHESDRVGEEGRGFHYLLDGLNAERILVASEAIAVGRRAIERATQYAKERVVFNRPIGMNQGVQFPLAESTARLEAADLVTQKALWQYDQGLPCGDMANMAKYLATEAAFEACDRAVQTHGGYGYAAEYHVERYFRETRVWKIAPISQNFILAYIAEKMLGLPPVLLMEIAMRPIRSLMFVPGHKDKFISRIPTLGADAIVLDLEDSVPDALKVEARDKVAGLIPGLVGVGPRLYVRTNRGAHAYDVDDLRAVVQPGLDGIFVSKAEDPTDVEYLSRLIAEIEHRRGMAVGGVKLIVPIETARAAEFVFDIVSNPRVAHLVQVTAKGADLERNLGFRWTVEGTETLYLRSRAVVAGRAAGKPHIIGGLWQEVHDLDGLRRSAEFNRTLGYTGEIVLHPSNVPVLNEIYSPAAADFDFYRGMIAAFAEAEAKGEGAVIYRGEHIDIAHVQTARAFLAQWGG